MPGLTNHVNVLVGRKVAREGRIKSRSEFEEETVEMDGLIVSVTLDLEPWEEA